MSIPLRFFDRNQGEKLRTKIDIKRNEKLREGAETQVYADVDSAFATVNSNMTLLRPYKRQYLQQAVRVRDTIFFSYQHGGAALLDFLNAESEYRAVELNYVNLVGAYLTAAAQMNMAVGREVIPMKKVLASSRGAARDAQRSSAPGCAGFRSSLLLAGLGAGIACSKDTPAATNKAPVTIDPDVFEADHPELFKTAKAQTRSLPTRSLPTAPSPPM